MMVVNSLKAIEVVCIRIPDPNVNIPLEPWNNCCGQQTLKNPTGPLIFRPSADEVMSASSSLLLLCRTTPHPQTPPDSGPP